MKTTLSENLTLIKHKTQFLHRIRLRKYTTNTEIRDVRPEGNLQADDEIIKSQDDLYIISWETEFDDFPQNSDTRNVPDDSSMNSDQQDTIITDLDLRSTRRDQNTDAATAEQREHELIDADIRSTRPQHDTHSDKAEQLPEQPAENTTDMDLKSTRTQSTPDSEIDKNTPKSLSVAGNSDFSKDGGTDIIVPDLSDKENDEMVVENEIHRGEKYNLRPTPNFIDENRY